MLSPLPISDLIYTNALALRTVSNLCLVFVVLLMDF